jgi:rfaE bifunctional protein kinase chain/domain
VNQSSIDKLLDSTGSTHLLVAGEIALDEYVWGTTTRISPEAPVPVIEVEKSTMKLGMAANVAQNILSLGAKATLISVIGQDENGQAIQSMLDDCGITKRTLIIDESRPTLRKMRVIAGKQHVVRVDYEKSHPLDPQIATQFRQSIESHVADVDGIIVQDYGKGLWTPQVMEFVKLARKYQCPIFVDPCRATPPSLYRHCALMSPNVLEAQAMTGGEVRFGRVSENKLTQLKKLANVLLDETEAKDMIITCGPDGMISLSGDRKSFNHIPTFAREVFDVTGAGDTVISVIALTQVLGLPIWRCMQIANAAAGIVVGRIGAGCVSKKELKEELQHLSEIGMLQQPSESLSTQPPGPHTETSL